MLKKAVYKRKKYSISYIKEDDVFKNINWVRLYTL